MSCVSWRQTGGCDPNGPREPEFDEKCGEPILDGRSGYCECENGRIVHKVGCPHSVFSCEEACSLPVIHQHVQGCILSGSIALQKVKSLSRFFLSFFVFSPLSLSLSLSLSHTFLNKINHSQCVISVLVCVW